MFVPPFNSKMFPKDIKEFGLRFKNCDVHSRCRHFIASAHSQHVPSNKPHVFIVFIRGEAKKDSLCRFRYDPYKQDRKQHTICFSLTKQMIVLPCNPGGITPILGLNFLRHLRDFLRHLRHLRDFLRDFLRHLRDFLRHLRHLRVFRLAVLHQFPLHIKFHMRLDKICLTAQTHVGQFCVLHSRTLKKSKLIIIKHHPEIA